VLTLLAGLLRQIDVSLRIILPQNDGDGWLWDWLDQMFSKWGSVVVNTAISALIVLIVAFLLACCIVPILRRQCRRSMDKQMGVMADLQLAQMMNMMTTEPGTKARFAQMVIGRPDRFPIPDYV